MNTILSNYINIWKVHFYTLPKIFYFDLIFLINIVFLFINHIYSFENRIYSFGDRVFTEFPPINSFQKIILI